LPDNKDPSARRACFGIPIRGLDLSCAQPLLEYQSLPYQQQQRQQQQKQQKQQQQPLASAASMDEAGASAAAAAAGAGLSSPSGCREGADGDGSGGRPSGFMLHAAFRMGPGAAHSTPALQLQAPPWFSAAALPPLPLPAWNAQAPLAEYATLVQERLQQHLAQHCAAAAAKYQVQFEPGPPTGPGTGAPWLAHGGGGAWPPSVARGAPSISALPAAAGALYRRPPGLASSTCPARCSTPPSCPAAPSRLPSLSSCLRSLPCC
jgi:hypothetical protein